MPSRIYNTKTGNAGLQVGADANGNFLQFENGMRMYSLTIAITKNVTTTSAPVGSLFTTSHATGRGRLFYSDGSKLQLIVATAEA